MVLREFGERQNSGGRGKFRGGNGCVREMEFTCDMNVSILSERRVFSPYGMEGGENGERGENLLIRRKNGKDVLTSVGGKSQISLIAGDRLRILTPGWRVG